MLLPVWDLQSLLFTAAHSLYNTVLQLDFQKGRVLFGKKGTSNGWNQNIIIYQQSKLLIIKIMFTTMSYQGVTPWYAIVINIILIINNLLCWLIIKI